jgi:hypothetical protein
MLIGYLPDALTIVRLGVLRLRRAEAQLVWPFEAEHRVQSLPKLARDGEPDARFWSRETLVLRHGALGRTGLNGLSLKGRER